MAVANNERKELDMLSKLKSVDGPFNKELEVSQYLYCSEPESSKKKRLKLEIQFAQHSSTTLPKTDPLFQVQVTLPNKKLRHKTPEEFGDAY